jgi:hypothetical protein
MFNINCPQTPFPFLSTNFNPNLPPFFSQPTAIFIVSYKMSPSSVMYSFLMNFSASRVNW